MSPKYVPAADPDPKNGPATPGVDKNAFFIPMNSGKPPVQRAVNRDPMGMHVEPTGLADSNVAGAEVFRDLARSQGLDPNQYGLILGGDEATQRVIAWAVDPLTDGATAVRINTAKKTLTTYLHELFAAKPKLRPDEPRWCAMRPDVDSDGVPCVLISLRVALEQRKGTRKPAKGSNGSTGA